MSQHLKIDGLESLIKRVKRLPETLETNKKDFLKKLAEIGVNTSSIRFESAQYDGVNDVTVDVEWVDDNTLLVVARGRAVTFIEFGTGITYTEQHPLADELGMVRGGYGKGRGKSSRWGYYGEKGTHGKLIRTTDKGDVILTSGNPPAKAMYEAGKEMRDKISEIAREVFT